MTKIIGSADSGPFAGAVLLEADDGLTALELLSSELGTMCGFRLDGLRDGDLAYPLLNSRRHMLTTYL